MIPDENENLGDNWVTNPNRDPADIEEEFDTGAADYEAMSAEWDYRGAQDGADFAMRHMGADASIVEAGCGTGLIGEILKNNGYKTLTGVDISAGMLEVAEQKGAYTGGLHKANICSMPFADDSFDGLICVAVLTYAADMEKVFKEFDRVLRSGAIMMFSHRIDLEDQCGFDTALAARLDSGRWITQEVTEPMLYYPNKKDYGTDVLIRFHAYKRA